MTSIAHRFNFHKLFFLGLIGVALFSVVAYLILTVATIFATAHRTAAAHSAGLLTSEISELESSYLSLESRITADEAQFRGFVAPRKVTYVSANAGSAALSFGGTQE